MYDVDEVDIDDEEDACGEWCRWCKGYRRDVGDAVMVTNHTAM